MSNPCSIQIYTARVPTHAHKYIESSLYYISYELLHISFNHMAIFRDIFELWFPMIAILHLWIGPDTCTALFYALFYAL